MHFPLLLRSFLLFVLCLPSLLAALWFSHGFFVLLSICFSLWTFQKNSICVQVWMLPCMLSTVQVLMKLNMFILRETLRAVKHIPISTACRYTPRKPPGLAASQNRGTQVLCQIRLPFYTKLKNSKSTDQSQNSAWSIQEAATSNVKLKTVWPQVRKNKSEVRVTPNRLNA